MLFRVQHVLQFNEGERCNHTFETRANQFVSPGYPNSFPNNAHCVTTISLQDVLEIDLIFAYVELDNSTTSGCSMDYIQVLESGSFDIYGGRQKITRKANLLSGIVLKQLYFPQLLTVKRL